MLSDLAPDTATLHQRLRATENLHHRYALLEQWVRNALARAASADQAVTEACRLLIADPRLKIDELARKFGWNARMIHRQFLGACGYGPKHFQRIMRIQRAIRVLHVEAPAGASDLAIAAGYADQAHMNRDFREITGFTPGRYFAIARPEVSAWIDEHW